MGQAIYEKEQQSASSPQAGAAEDGAQSAEAEDVVDAEFSEVNEDNKG
jgi:molecular chaperone DnaK